MRNSRTCTSGCIYRRLLKIEYLAEAVVQLLITCARIEPINNKLMAEFKRPESVLVVIYTEDGAVLQLRRCNPLDFWQSVTGSLQRGETPIQAVIREVFEETGLQADTGLSDSGIVNRYPIHPAWRKKFAPDVKENIEHVFALRLPSVIAIRLDPKEHQEYRWLQREEAAELASSVTDRHAILKLVPEKL
jgi:dATP pyrophosphohydrolase